MMFDLFKQNTAAFYTLTIILTIIALIFATAYTMRNLIRLWSAGKPKPVNLSDDEAEYNKTKSRKENKAGDTVKQHTGDGDNDFTEADRTVENEIDPVEYCEHIQSEVKKAKQRVTMKQLGQNLTAEQLDEERRTQHDQLQSIFQLMQEQDEKFGVGTVDEIQDQMKLYA